MIKCFSKFPVLLFHHATPEKLCIAWKLILQRACAKNVYAKASRRDLEKFSYSLQIAIGLALQKISREGSREMLQGTILVRHEEHVS